MTAPLEPPHRGRTSLRTRLIRHEGRPAACLVAAAEAAKRGLRGDVVVTCGRRRGADPRSGRSLVLKRVRADAAIVAEPTHMEVGQGPQGVRRLRDRDGGARCARLAAGPGDRRDREDGPRPRRLTRSTGRCASAADAPPPRLGVAPCGGRRWSTGFSTYPERCVLQDERRTVPGRRSTTSKRSSRTARPAPARRPDFKGSWRTVAARRAFEVATNEEIVRLVRQYAGRGKPVGETYWADSALLAEARYPDGALSSARAATGHTRRSSGSRWRTSERCAAVFLSVASEFCA